MTYAGIREMVKTLRQGELAILINDAQNNQGMLMGLAEQASPEMINTLLTIGTGLTYVAITEQRAGEIGLSPMVSRNTNSRQTAFTASVDAVGVTTGISASERAFTARMMCDPGKGAESFHKPGHVFPLISRRHGILERLDFTEAAVELAKLAMAFPAGVLCEILDLDGAVASLDYIEALSSAHCIPMMKLSELARNCFEHKPMLQLTSTERLTWDGNMYTSLHWTNPVTGKKLLSLVPDEANGDALEIYHTWDCAFGNLLEITDKCSCPVHFSSVRRRARERSAIVIHHHYPFGEEPEYFSQAYERQMTNEIKIMHRI